MNAWKKCMTRMASSRPLTRLLALVLVVAMAILPTMAEILSMMPDPPTFSYAGFGTSYDSTDKTDRVELPDGTYKDLPYTEHTYTVNIHADYILDKLENTELSKQAIKDILKENLPATVYDMIISRDPGAIRDILADFVKEKVMDYFRTEVEDELGTETDGAAEISMDELQLNAGGEILGGGSIPGELESELEAIAPVDGAITADLWEQIKNLADKLIGEDKPFTKEQIVDIVDMDKIVEHFDISRDDLPHEVETDGNGDEVTDENGDPVKQLDKIGFLDELLDGKHDEDILDNRNQVTFEEVAKDVVDADKLEEHELSYTEILRIVIEELKDEVVDLISRVHAITVGADRVPVFSELPGQDGRLNLSALEQVMLDSIPTLDELVEKLGSGESADVLYEMNFFVHLKKKGTENEYNYDNYVIRIQVDGTKEHRADLGEYIKDAEDYFTYDYELPPVEDRYSSEAGKSDGTLTLNLKLPVGLLNVALKVINEENLDAELCAKLGEAAKLDFSNEDNHPAIINAIIQNLTVVDLARLLKDVKGEDIHPDGLEKYNLTADAVDTVVDYLNRGLNKLEQNADFGNLDSDSLKDFYQNGGTFTYEDTLYADAVEAVEKIRTLPQYVKDRVEGTELRHTVRVNINLEDIFKVTYIRGGVETVEFMEVGSALNLSDAPYGWVENGDETLTGLTVLPARDVFLTALRKLTYRYRYNTTEDFSEFVTYFTENTLDSLAKPTPKPGYFFNWDYSSLDGSADAVLELSSAELITYEKPVTWTIGGVAQPDATVEFQVEKPIIDSLNEQLAPTQKPGYVGSWWIYEAAPVARKARDARDAETGTWRELTDTDMPSADNVALTVDYRYTPIEYERVYVNGVLQVGLKFTVEMNILDVVASLTAELESANPGKTVKWFRFDGGVKGAEIAADEKPAAEQDLNLTFELIDKTYTVTFTDYDGAVLKTETVTHGGSATAPTAPTREGYSFTGWSGNYTNVTADVTVTAQYHIKSYTVTFKDHDGAVLKTETVNHGAAATAPAAPTREGYTFTGWDKAFNNITGDLIVIAQYQIKTYTVTFKDHDGTTLKTQTVNHGATATAPAAPTREGYTFTGWDKALTNVTSNLTVTAQYSPKTYTVTFRDHDGTTLKTQTVNHGAAATAPSAPTRVGYDFVGWDKVFNNVTSDLTVTAQYQIKTYTVIFKDHDGATLKTQTVNHGAAATAPANPTREGYNFSGWDKAFTNVTSDLTVTATYAVKTYTVTFKDHDGTALKTETVNHGAAATAPAAPTREGYTFSGWDKAFTNVKSDLTVTATYTVNSYTVTFKDHDGTTLKTETVEYGKSATAPADPTRKGYTFGGWDVAFTEIKSDLTVTAQYTLTEYALVYINGEHQADLTFTVEQTVLSVVEGLTAQLKADNPGATVEWYYGDNEAEGGTPVGAEDKPNADEELRLFYKLTGLGTETIPPETEPETEPETTLPGPSEGGMVNSSFDSLYLNGNIYREEKLFEEPIHFAKDDHHSITLNGWIGFDQPIAQFGYFIDNQPRQWSDTFTTEPPADHNGGEYAKGFSIVADLRELEPGTHYVTFIVRLEDGSIYLLRDPSCTITVVISDEPAQVDKEGFPWWILILVLLLIVAAVVVVLILLRRKKTEEPAPVPPTEDEPEPELPVEDTSAETAPLFIPLGEEVPEEEIPDTIEILDEVSADDVDMLMTDKVAEHFLEISVEMGGVGKMGIINVGQISESYLAEDHVDLLDLQRRGLVDDNVGRLKVLAAGKLDKALYIKADAFSVQAIKMITLTGGHAIKLGSGIVRPHEPKAASDRLFDAHEDVEIEEDVEEVEDVEVVEDVVEETEDINAVNTGDDVTDSTEE